MADKPGKTALKNRFSCDNSVVGKQVFPQVFVFLKFAILSVIFSVICAKNPRSSAYIVLSFSKQTNVSTAPVETLCLPPDYRVVIHSSRTLKLWILLQITG